MKANSALQPHEGNTLGHGSSLFNREKERFTEGLRAAPPLSVLRVQDYVLIGPVPQTQDRI